MDKKQLETLTEEELEQFDVVGGLGPGGSSSNVNQKTTPDLVQSGTPGNQIMKGNQSFVNGLGGNYAQGKGIENTVLGKGNPNQINAEGKTTQQS